MTSNRFLALIEEKRRQEAEQQKAKDALRQPVETFAEDLIPQVYEKTDEEADLDTFVDNIDIVDAYRRWSNKSPVTIRPGQTESIKVSCPNPSHPDKHPSAWFNINKQTGYCAKCGGWDAHDIAAWNIGFDVPGYKTDGTFPKLRRKMAEEYGWTFNRTIGGEWYSEPPVPETPIPHAPDIALVPDETRKSDISDPHDSSSSSDDEGTDSNVVELYDDGDQESIALPPIDWKLLLPENTFLRKYMEIATQDDITEEYHFFNGLVALGFALGRDVRLFDLHPVYGNLFVCTLGRTGSGKSQARSHLVALMAHALKYDPSADFPKGVKRISSPASAETLIDTFIKPVKDPNTGTVAAYAPLRGLIDFNELSALLGKAARAGNILKPVMMQFYDMDSEVGTSSRQHGDTIARNPYASCLTTSQPRALRDLVSNSDDASGFLNRWVFVGGPEKKRSALGGVRIDITPVVPLLDSIIGWAGSFGPNDMISWSEEAIETWTHFFYMRVQKDKAKWENAGSELLSRIDLTCKKLILLLTANEMKKEVPEYVVARVIRLYDYLLRCYGVPESEIGNTLENQVTEAILYQVKRMDNGEGVTISAVAKALKRRRYPKDMILKNLEALVKLGFVTEHRGGNASGKGRPAESNRYRYVG